MEQTANSLLQKDSNNFAAEQISELLQSGAIAESEKSETVRINPLSVAKVIPRNLTKKCRVMVTEVAQRMASGCRQAFRWPMIEEERRETECWFGILRGSK
ncbi:50S ribosomal protein L22 domain protein, partial [Oesophagostomum dentatum]